MKKYLVIILSLLLISPFASASDFKPATLYKIFDDTILRVGVFNKQEADYGFSKGFKLEKENFETSFGSSITVIDGSDTVQNALKVITNANFTALNTDKLETSSYYATTTHANISSLPALATVGTITTGTWSADAIAVNKSGTGTTTPNRYSVILGNGADGLTIASSTGTSGQSLVSGGAGAYPSWQSVAFDTADDYINTGDWRFQGETNITASSSIASTSVDILSVNTGKINNFPTASTSIVSKGYVNADNFTKFIPATTGSLAAATYFVNYDGDWGGLPLTRFLDGQIAQHRLNFKVPYGATSISSIKIIAIDEVAANLYLKFNTTSMPPNDGGAITTDSSDALTTYAQGSGNTVSVITVPAAAYNGINISSNNIIGLLIYRDSVSATDSYNAVWNVFGVEITFN